MKTPVEVERRGGREVHPGVLEPLDLVSRHRDELTAQGYSIMPQALPVDFCDELVAEFDRMRGVWRRSLVQDFHGRNTVRYFDLLNCAAAVFQRVPIAPRILAVVRATLGDDCLLGTYGSVSIGPGNQPR